MNLDVLLAGHADEWRFHGSAAFAHWLSSEPWHAQGGLAAIRLPGMAVGEEFTAAIRRELFGRDAGAGGMHYMDVTAEDLAEGGVRLAVQRKLLYGEGGEATPRAAQQLADELQARPTVIAITPPSIGS